jgi:hypothetical protein
MAMCSMVDGTQRFGTTYCQLLQGKNASCIFRVQMVVEGSSQTSAPLYQVTWSNIPEDSNFRIYEFTLKTEPNMAV